MPSLPSLVVALSLGVTLSLFSGCGPTGTGDGSRDAAATTDASQSQDAGQGSDQGLRDGSMADGAINDAGADDGSVRDSGAAPDSGTRDGGSGTLAVRPSAGCGVAGSPTGALTNQTSNVNGSDRGYNAFVPTPYVATEPHALIFTYHGAGGTANTNQFQFDTYSTNRGAHSIQVAPQGWTHPSWDTNHFVPFNLEDSLVLFDQVLEHMSNTYCIDLNRVFAMGHSNGGQMAFHLGCLRGDVLRAVLPSSGRCFSYGPGVCDPFHASNAQQCVGDVMVLSVMGEDDTTRHADEAATVEGFRVRNGCSLSTEARDPAPCTRFTGCDANAEVAACRIPGLAHAIWRDGRSDMYTYLMSL